METGGVALYIEQQCIYQVAETAGAYEEAMRDLRERACAVCRDPLEGPQRWGHCVVFFDNGERAIHFS